MNTLDVQIEFQITFFLLHLMVSSNSEIISLINDVKMFLEIQKTCL